MPKQSEQEEQLWGIRDIQSRRSFLMGASVAAGNVLYTDDADTFLTYMKELRGGFDEA
ncbi:MAG: hypothetical protein ACLTDR_10290 [Adlercreutzia equolifaciens]